MNPNHSTNKELLVDKLQGALAKFRNERDQLHRSKRLALERCRLIQAEEEALSKTVQALRNKYDDLTASSAKIDAEIGPLEQQVEQETKEVRSESSCSFAVVPMAFSLTLGVVLDAISAYRTSRSSCQNQNDDSKYLRNEKHPGDNDLQDSPVCKSEPYDYCCSQEQEYSSFVYQGTDGRIEA